MNGWKPVKKSMKKERFQVQNLEPFFFCGKVIESHRESRKALRGRDIRRLLL